MTDQPFEVTVQTDENGVVFIQMPDGTRRYVVEEPPYNHGPFLDEEGEEFFLTNDEPAVRYYPPKVELPLFYTCEHGSSNTPDICILVVHPDAKPVPDDWYADPAAPYALAPPHVRAKIAAAQAGLALDPGPADSVTFR